MKRPKGIDLTIMIGVPKPRRRMADGAAVGEPLRPPYQPPDEDEDEDEDEEEEGDEEAIVAEALRALRGESRNPEMALQEFVETFGREALGELRQMAMGQEAPAVEEPLPAAHGRLMRGKGGGLDDTIPARNGDQDVLLSDGEFVIPADVVSMLGDGSTDAGSRVLQQMMARVRKEKTGRPRQARALKQARVLPV